MKIKTIAAAVLALTASFNSVAETSTRYLKRVQLTLNTSQSPENGIPALLDSALDPSTVEGYLTVKNNGPMTNLDANITFTVDECTATYNKSGVTLGYTDNGVLYIMQMPGPSFERWFVFIRRAPSNVYDPVTIVQTPISTSCGWAIATLDFRQNP
jgi:hypothetical protein